LDHHVCFGVLRRAILAPSATTTPMRRMPKTTPPGASSASLYPDEGNANGNADDDEAENRD
jgi:hypothetical protein